MTGWLAGHVALLVGAGSGIGNATLDAFLAEGARVAALELSPDKCAALAERYPKVLVLRGDNSVAEDNRRAVRDTVSTFGALHSAISFVGLHDQRAQLSDLAGGKLHTAFDEIFSVNVRSCLELAAAAETELRQSHGTLVLTLSNSAYDPGGGGALYVASKFALRGVIAQLAHEWAPHIRVNGVAPGGTVGTDLRGPAALGASTKRNADRPNRAARIRASNPLGIAAEPADHAAAYVYLASARSRAVTGEIVRSDGGIRVR